MNQQRKLSRHNSRQSSVGETASVGSAKSGKSNGSSEYYLPTSNSQQTSATNNKNKRHNGLSKHGSQDSGDSISTGGGSQPSATNRLNVAEMLLHGVADNEILDIWLRSIDCEEFVAKFIDSGYDMPTISRITPQDLAAIGVTEPTKRLKILTEIRKLNLQDGIPNFVPASLSHWLSLIRLDSYYYKSLCDQQIDTIEKLCQLTWEDFEELGITKLGHQKRFQIAIERVKELEDEAKSNSSKPLSEPIYDTNPNQILLVASSENHSMNGPIINKQSSTSELSSTGSGSMHSVHSSASTQYQPTYAPLAQQQQQPQQLQQAPNQHLDSHSLGGHTNAANNHNHHMLNGIQQHHISQQAPIYSQQQPPPPLIYQQPSPLGPIGSMQQQSHYQQMQPAQQLSMQFAATAGADMMSNHNKCNNNGIQMNGSGNIHNPNLQQQQPPPQHNRQSMSQLPFSALARLPKHQQQILQQSSIYATLRRQPPPSKAKQPPPPVPIRTNSLKSNTLTEHHDKQEQQQQQMNQQLYQQPQQQQYQSHNNYQPEQQLRQQQPQLNNCHNVNSSSSLFGGLAPPPPPPLQQQPQPQQVAPSGLAPTNCNATTGKDDNFPPPPSPLSITDSDEHDLVSLNSDSNFTDVGHGMMTFRVGN